MRISDWSSDVCSSDLGLDLDDAVVDFGHFLREQLLHELAVRAAEEDLRAAAFAAHAGNDSAHPVAAAKHPARYLLVEADHALLPVHDDGAIAKLPPLPPPDVEYLHWCIQPIHLPLHNW